VVNDDDVIIYSCCYVTLSTLLGTGQRGKDRSRLRQCKHHGAKQEDNWQGWRERKACFDEVYRPPNFKATAF